MKDKNKNNINQRSILIVEDNPGHAELIQESIKEANVINKIVWIDNGTDAVEYIKGYGKYDNRVEYPTPCLILLDLKLPGKDGKEILKIVKSDDLTRSIPVVMLTSSEQERDMEECYRLGANSYITKPVDFGDFMDKVQAIPVYWLLINEHPNT